MAYQYHYVVRGNVKGLEPKLKAELNLSEKRRGQEKALADVRWDKPDKTSFGNRFLGLFLTVFSIPALWLASQEPLPLPIVLVFLLFFSIGLGLVFGPLIRYRTSHSLNTGYLAQQLNNHPAVMSVTLKAGFRRLTYSPDKKNQCVRTIPTMGPATSITVGPLSIDAAEGKAFPTRQAFEAYDRIAGVIRQIQRANARRQPHGVPGGTGSPDLAYSTSGQNTSIIYLVRRTLSSTLLL